MGRTASLAFVVGIVAWLASWRAAAVAQDGGIYRYRDREGRTVYTNLEGVASHGREREELRLPPLSSVDFAHALPEQLRELDQRVRDAHGALQAGEYCDAIRKTSRVPLGQRVFAEHSRKLYVAGGLLLFSIALGYLGSRRRLGSLLPVAPLLGCAYLGYATFVQTREGIQTLTSGLRACSEELPDGQADDAPAVKSRLARALDVRSSVHAAYEKQAREIEAIMRER